MLGVADERSGYRGRIAIDPSLPRRTCALSQTVAQFCGISGSAPAAKAPICSGFFVHPGAEPVTYITGSKTRCGILVFAQSFTEPKTASEGSYGERADHWRAGGNGEACC